MPIRRRAASLLSVGAMVMVTGCPGLTSLGQIMPSASPSSQSVSSSFSASPSSTPSTAPSLPPGSSLEGRLQFSLGANLSPGATVSFQLWRKTSLDADFSAMSNKFSTDRDGSFRLGSLVDAQYELYYFDQNEVLGDPASVVARVFSAPVRVSATQTSIPRIDLDLAWDFTTLMAAGDATASGGSIKSFTFPTKPGAGATATYQVIIYDPNGSVVAWSLPDSTTTATVSIPSVSYTSLYRYVVRFLDGKGMGGESKKLPLYVYYSSPSPTPSSSPTPSPAGSPTPPSSPLPSSSPMPSPTWAGPIVQ